MTGIDRHQCVYVLKTIVDSHKLIIRRRDHLTLYNRGVMFDQYQVTSLKPASGIVT